MTQSTGGPKTFRGKERQQDAGEDTTKKREGTGCKRDDERYRGEDTAEEEKEQAVREMIIVSESGQLMAENRYSIDSRSQREGTDTGEKEGLQEAVGSEGQISETYRVTLLSSFST